MRTALLISGNPRFTENFDSQLSNLYNSEIDWYVALWCRGEFQDNRTSSNWVDVETEAEALQLIEPHVPQGHTIKSIKLLDPYDYLIMPRDYETGYFPTIFIWHQYMSLKICDHMRRASGVNYDLVIRSRPDVGLDRLIDLEFIKNALQTRENWIVTPDNQKHGHAPQLCDQFAIGLPKTMTAYCDAVDMFDDLYLGGVDYNPECLLQAALWKQGIEYPPCNFNIVRPEDYRVVAPHGRWGQLSVRKNIT